MGRRWYCPPHLHFTFFGLCTFCVYRIRHLRDGMGSVIGSAVALPFGGYIRSEGSRLPIDTLLLCSVRYQPSRSNQPNRNFSGSQLFLNSFYLGRGSRLVSILFSDYFFGFLFLFCFVSFFSLLFYSPSMHDIYTCTASTPSITLVSFHMDRTATRSTAKNAEWNRNGPQVEPEFHSIGY